MTVFPMYSTAAKIVNLTEHLCYFNKGITEASRRQGGIALDLGIMYISEGDKKMNLK